MPGNDNIPLAIQLTKEEIYELRSKKQKLSEYGKKKLRNLMNKEQSVMIELTIEDMETILHCINEYVRFNDELYEKDDELQENVKNVGNKILYSYKKIDR